MKSSSGLRQRGHSSLRSDQRMQLPAARVRVSPRRCLSGTGCDRACVADRRFRLDGPSGGNAALDGRSSRRGPCVRSARADAFHASCSASSPGPAVRRGSFRMAGCCVGGLPARRFRRAAADPGTGSRPVGISGAATSRGRQVSGAAVRCAGTRAGQARGAGDVGRAGAATAGRHGDHGRCRVRGMGPPTCVREDADRHCLQRCALCRESRGPGGACPRVGGRRGAG